MKPRNILLTGAGSGLGRGIALDMAARGHRLLLMDRDETGLKDTVALLRSDGVCIKAECLDVSSAAQIGSFIAGLDNSERVDVLINNAGLQHVAPLEEFPEERWEQHVLQFMQGETHVEGKYAAEIRKDTQLYRHT